MDTKSFPWNMLINVNDPNGGQSFEEIAFGYVESNFSQYCWKKTPQTRDGNKDAYAVISLFSTHQGAAEVWMEAKFSVKRKNMSRYTVDKTIVSALSEGNVSKLFFVTNMLVNQRVRKQLLSALKIDGFEYNDVHFCTKYDLEVWLSNTPIGKTFFDRYFSGCCSDDYQLNHIKILGSPAFYDANLHNYLFPEPLSVLRYRSTYIAEITVYSPKKTLVLFNTLGERGVNIINSNQFPLQKGINELSISFIVNHTDSPQSKCITISDGQHEDILEIPVAIQNNSSHTIQIQAQEKAKSAIIECYKKYKRRTTNSVVNEIVAHAGMGKSYLLEQLTGDKVFRHESIIFYTFSSIRITNYRILVELYLRLFYYSINIEDVMDNLKAPVELMQSMSMLRRNEHSKLEDWMQHSQNKQLIPMDFQKERLIVLDNTERLSEGQSVFLTSLINNICSSNSHSFIIVSGRQQKITIAPHRIVFHPQDIVENLKPHFSHRLSAVASLIGKLVFDVSSLALFIENLRDVDNDLAKALATSSYHSLVENILQNKFDNILSFIKSETKELLTLIYTLTDGLSYTWIEDDDENDFIQPLIEANLVKHGTDAFLPINSLASSFFKSNFTSYAKKGEMWKRYFRRFSEDEKLRFDLGSAKFYNKLKKAVNRSQELMDMQDYIMTAYILEPLFSPSIKAIESENPTLVRLHFNYIYAKANIDTHYPIRKRFEEFAENIVSIENRDSKICRIKALAEVVCFAFEDMDLQTVHQVTNEVNELCKDFPCDPETNRAIFLCKSTVLLSLCAEDKYEDAETLLKRMEIDYGDTPNMHITKIRYARHLYHKDIDMAMGILQEMLPLLEREKNPKWSNACALDIKFLSYLKNGVDDFVFNGMNAIRDSLPQYVSLYRSKLQLLSACALVNANEKSENDKLNEYRNFWLAYKNESGCSFNKAIAYDYLLEAAVEYLNNNYARMITLLEASNSHFQNFGKSYKIVIQHNKTINNHLESINKKVYFYNTNSIMKENYFYLDPRL